jgi:hypothetical protein
VEVVVADNSRQGVAQGQAGLPQFDHRAVIRSWCVEITVLDIPEETSRSAADLGYAAKDLYPVFGGSRATAPELVATDQRVGSAVGEPSVDPGINLIGDVTDGSRDAAAVVWLELREMGVDVKHQPIHISPAVD